MVELEEKFCKMMEQNWEKVKQRGTQLGYEMGTCQIIQGDARQLENILCDKIITSPPFSSMIDRRTERDKFFDKAEEVFNRRYLKSRDSFTRGQPENPDNIDNLPYGQIDKIVTSPPYEGSLIGSDNPKYDTEEYKKRMAKLPSGDYSTPGRARAIRQHESGYSINENNIGNLQLDSYLEAMLQVYKTCFVVLKCGGLMVLVVKNFIRNKQIVRLDLDTIKLCEQAGFQHIDTYKRKLSSQSFWRVIYQKKFPDVPLIDYEEVLIFRKG